MEQDKIFSLNASIQNSNGQSAQFSTGGDSASVTITNDDGMWFAVYIYASCIIYSPNAHAKKIHRQLFYVSICNAATGLQRPIWQTGATKLKHTYS